MKVKLIRGVFIGREAHKKDAEIEVTDDFGRALVAMKKAVILTGEAAARGPMTTTTAASLTGGVKRGEGK